MPPRWSSGWPRPTTYPLRCVWLRRLSMERRMLRRSTVWGKRACPKDPHKLGCWASAIIGDFRSSLPRDLEGDVTGTWDRQDPRWPKTCEACGYRFKATDAWLYDRHRLYRYKGPYGTHRVTINQALPGSIYHARWLEGTGWGVGPDGLALHGVCPNGRHWHIDGQASNCTMPQDKGKTFVRTHYCWIRHGDPRHPETLHVDKQGVTCAAGAGSIVAGDYHGFLHHGGFTAG